MADSFGAKQRIDQALEALRIGLSPFVAEKMKQHHGKNWRQYTSRAAGGSQEGELDTYALLKTILDNYGDVFRHEARIRKARSYISLALDARNSASHFDGWLLLDSRVVDVTRSYNPIFITISSLKPFLFNDLINEWRCVDRMEA
jgi:hypothetical protein